ncbi:MAG: c-type cytochrome [Candidatus Sericytochromatia bacterium]|nr:c-type cytochrome [Candidatus Sericytochromatia bacterium]
MPQVLDHAVDGIEEYDTPVPRWWLYLFYGTIVWAIGYMIAYPSWFGPGQSGWHQNGAWVAEVDAHDKAHPKPGGDTLMAHVIGDATAIAAGKQVFAQNCAACHGPEGKGLIGPNLTDETWLYGGKPEQIAKTITEGAPKGMPAWGPILGPTKIPQAAAFVYSLSHH